MKVSLDWLQEFVDHGMTPADLARKLTFAGLEVEGIERLTPRFSGVVVARITACGPHPDADKLKVCAVDAGDGEARQIVCGAPNARVGLLAPLAVVGATLPDGSRIKASRLRGVESQGMLCSARELGLGEDADGLLELADEATVGQPLGAALALDDTLLELNITPNRGDCLSMLGVAREAAALSGRPLRLPPVAPVAATIRDVLPIRVDDAVGCPRYAGRLIRGIRTDARTPQWLRERLRRAGLRAIHPVVDVTNFVMLERGQPMHGFDAATLVGGIVVRAAQAGERITLLDGREVTLDAEVLAICDQQRIRALAGVMGGEDSGVSAATTDVYFESAWFRPTRIAGRARRFGLHTDAAQRFERGVDATGQVAALERATALLLSIAGGQPGPISVTEASEHLPTRPHIRLRASRLKSLLGIEIERAEAGRLLGALGGELSSDAEGWRLVAPSHRFDLEREEDLVEEVGRLHGYEHIPAARYPAPLTFLAAPEGETPSATWADTLVGRGYEEAITYSFVDPGLQATVLGTGDERLQLANPIASDLAEMRASLLPGLIGAVRWNLARQQERVRLFEQGSKYLRQADDTKEIPCIGAMAVGTPEPRQWGLPARALDFADLRGDVEALLQASGLHDVVWEPASVPWLHPGQSAVLRVGTRTIGWAGGLHPRLIQALELPEAAFAFEIEVAGLSRAVPKAQVPSRFPAIQRDLAVVVTAETPAERVVEVARQAAGEGLADLVIFDVYRGKGIEAGRKSLAMSLILQDSSRTLTDEETETVVARVVRALADQLGAHLRT